MSAEQGSAFPTFSTMIPHQGKKGPFCTKSKKDVEVAARLPKMVPRLSTEAGDGTHGREGQGPLEKNPI